MSFSSKQKKYLKHLGARIKQIRISKELTQAQLAADLSIEISQISRIERGVINTTILSLKSIADALEVNISELIVAD